MTTRKEQLERQRTHHAAAMARVAMRLQHAKQADVDGLLAEADAALRGFRLAKLAQEGDRAMKDGAEFSPTVKNEPVLQALAKVIDDNVKPDGFILLVFTDQGTPGQRCNYVSNCARQDAVDAMAEFIATHEASK